MLNDKYIDLFFRVKINFIDRTGTKISVMAEVGDNLLDVAKDADIDGVEGGFILFTYFCIITHYYTNNSKVLRSNNNYAMI